MKNNDVIYFSVNNWFCGRDYPDTKNFRKWMSNDLKQSFQSDEWCKENKLCVYHGLIDMSCNYTVSAPREWVEKNCPELLTDKEYSYYLMCSGAKGTWKEEHKKKYSDFVCTPEEGEDTPDPDYFDMPFREYCEKNFGSEYYETHWWGDDEDEDEENENNDDED